MFLCTGSRTNVYINDLAQDCSNSIANTLKLLQYCTKPLIYDCPNDSVATLKNMGKYPHESV